MTYRKTLTEKTTTSCFKLSKVHLWYFLSRLKLFSPEVVFLIIRSGGFIKGSSKIYLYIIYTATRGQSSAFLNPLLKMSQISMRHWQQAQLAGAKRGLMTSRDKIRTTAPFYVMTFSVVSTVPTIPCKLHMAPNFKLSGEQIKCF